MPADATKLFLRKKAIGLSEVVPKLWHRPLIFLSVCWFAIFAAFFRDWADMAEQWWNSSTYNHILFVPLILGWLVLLRWQQLSRLTPSGWWPGLLVAAMAAFVWLCGALAGIDQLRHIGVVGMLQASVLTILGPKVTVGLVFPLSYMVFLVPFGDELVPPLQMITAAITIILTEWSGISAVIDGVFIDTPAGLFEVAEACSGVKFLVAMAALSTLVAHVGFRNWTRRAVFLSFALIVPILANGVRAWGTIFIAQSQGVEFAAGFDHIFYGWIFFALVLAMVLALAWRYFDRTPDDTMIEVDAISNNPLLDRIVKFGTRYSLGAIGIVAIAIGALSWSVQNANAQAHMPTQIALPNVQEWSRVDFDPAYPWAPQAPSADHQLLGTYANAEGRRVDVFVALYASQTEGNEASGYGTGAISPDGDWRWLASSDGRADYAAQWMLIAGNHKRYAETTYRQGEFTGGSGARLRLATLTGKLMMRQDRTATLILSAEGANARETVASFAAAIGSRGRWLDAITTPR